MKQIQKQIQRAIKLQSQSKLKQAQTIYESILKVDPRNVDALNFLGTIYLQMKNLPEAEKWMRKAILEDPFSASANNNLGNILREMKRYDDAITSYQTAIRLDRKSVV